MKDQLCGALTLLLLAFIISVDLYLGCETSTTPETPPLVLQNNRIIELQTDNEDRDSRCIEKYYDVFWHNEKLFRNTFETVEAAEEAYKQLPYWCAKTIMEDTGNILRLFVGEDRGTSFIQMIYEFKDGTLKNHDLKPSR